MYRDRGFDREGYELMAKHYESRRQEKVQVLKDERTLIIEADRLGIANYGKPEEGYMHGYGKTRVIQMDGEQHHQERDVETVKMSRPQEQQKSQYEYKSSASTSGLNEKDIQEIERMKAKQVRNEFFG